MGRPTTYSAHTHDDVARGRQVGSLNALAALLGWSTVPLLLRDLAGRGVDFWSNNGWRYGASALIWLPYVIWHAWCGRMPKGIWKAAIIPSIANIAGQACFTAAFGLATPGIVTFGLRSQLIFVALGAWFLFPSERAVMRSARYLVGFALLITGLMPVLFDGECSLSGANGSGVMMAICSGLGYACYGLSVRRFMAPYHPVLAFAVICQITAVGLVALMLAFGRDGGAYVPSLGSRELIFLALGAIIGIAAGHVFYYIAIARLGVAVTSGVLQLQPFLVSAASVIVFEERLTGLQWLGGFVAVGGALLMLTAERKAPQQAQASTETGD
ncbi:MAG: DMT family transporter [Phycisphaerae bacterium]|nr:DMT family transporter [Phycisphaerae bacterium]